MIAIFTHRNKMNSNTLEFRMLNWHQPFFRSLSIVIIVIRPDVWIDGLFIVTLAPHSDLFLKFLLSIVQIFTYKYAFNVLDTLFSPIFYFCP